MFGGKTGRHLPICGSLEAEMEDRTHILTVGRNGEIQRFGRNREMFYTTRDISRRQGTARVNRRWNC